LQTADIDFSKLDDLERETIDTIVPLIEQGFSFADVAAQVGGDAKEIERRVDDLGARLVALSGAIELPPLADDEYEALKQSIADHGQQMPILRGSPRSGLPGVIIDGRTRRTICAQLRIEPIYADRDGTADQLRSLGLVLNLARRHMSTSSRRGIIKAKLLADPSRSDRAIAAALGVSHPTVAAVRRDLEGAGEVEKLSTRTSRDGAQRPAASTRSPQPPPQHRSIRVLIPTELFEHYAGSWVECRAFRLLERRPGVHELQVQLLDTAAATDEQLAEARWHIESVAGRTNVDVDVARVQMLKTASDVFGRTIEQLEDLHVDEAQWLVARLQATPA
jgi:ParB-like chromosome segregation protein Spo0J